MYYFNFVNFILLQFGNFLSHWSGVTVCILPYYNLLQMNANLIPVKYRNCSNVVIFLPLLCAITATCITSTYVTWRRK